MKFFYYIAFSNIYINEIGDGETHISVYFLKYIRADQGKVKKVKYISLKIFKRNTWDKFTRILVCEVIFTFNRRPKRRRGRDINSGQSKRRNLKNREEM